MMALDSQALSRFLKAGPYGKILCMLLVRSWVSKRIRLAAFLLLSGFFLTVSPSSLLLAQTPHGLGPHEHLSREARLAALGLLTPPIDDYKIIKPLSDPDWFIRV